MEKAEIISKLQYMLDECMSYANQEGSLKITDIDIDDNGLEGTGTIKFDWCTPEPENEEPYFMGY